MTITTKDTGTKAELDKANVNTLATHLAALRFGSFMRAMKTTLMKAVPQASSYQVATLEAIVLAEDAKAATLLRAYARAGSGTLGELAIQAFGATPTAGQIAIAPNGDIVVLAADAYTSIDLVYEPYPHDVLEYELDVATGVVTIPAPALARGVIALLEAEVLAGTITGKKGILVPLAGGGAGLPATTLAQLTSAKTTVSFNNATDVPTKARIKLAVALDVNVDALLSAQSNAY